MLPTSCARGGQLDGQHFVVRLPRCPARRTAFSDSRTVQGEPGGVFAPPDDETEAGGLFTAARRQSSRLGRIRCRGIEPPDFVPLARHLPKTACNEWGLMDGEGRVLKAYEYDPGAAAWLRRARQRCLRLRHRQTDSAGRRHHHPQLAPGDGPDETHRRAIELLCWRWCSATVMG